MEITMTQLEYMEGLLIESANVGKCEELLSNACTCLDNYDSETAFNEINRAIDILKLDVRTSCSKERRNLLKDSTETLQMLTHEMKLGNRNQEISLSASLTRVHKTIMQCNW